MIVKKKVLYIVNIPSPYRVSFFNELGKLCNLTVLFERKSSDARSKSWHDYNFENFSGHFLKGIKFKSNRSISIDFHKYLKNNKFDHIVIGGYSTPTGILAIMYLKFTKTPFVLNIDGGLINKSENFFVKKTKELIISSASTWLSTGNIGKNYLEYYGANSKKIFIYPFTTLYKKEILTKPLNHIEKNMLRRKLGISGNKIIITVGSFIHRKGFDILIKSVADLDDDHTVFIVGGNPTVEYLDLIESLEISNIVFLDFMPKNKLFEYYRASDLFVLPTREDIWGLVVQEAMANALPIITTNKCVAGMELILDYQNGFIVPTDDSTVLSSKIMEITGNINLLLQMSENNLIKSKMYTLENMAFKTFEILSNFDVGE